MKKFSIPPTPKKEKQSIHFLHIGKTGGTAIKYCLDQFPETEHYTIRTRGHKAKLRNVARENKVIFFVRDPISKFVSGFYSRKRQGQPRYFTPWDAEEEMAFSYFKTPDHLANSITSDNINERDAAHRAMNNIRFINDSYWYWFEDEMYLNSRLHDIFFIGFQESLDQDFCRLRKKLEIPDSVNLPKDDILAHRNPSSSDKYLTKNSENNLKDWYKKEYQFIEICRKLYDAQS